MYEGAWKLFVRMQKIHDSTLLFFLSPSPLEGAWDSAWVQPTKKNSKKKKSSKINQCAKKAICGWLWGEAGRQREQMLENSIMSKVPEPEVCQALCVCVCVCLRRSARVCVAATPPQVDNLRRSVKHKASTISSSDSPTSYPSPATIDKA